MTKPFELTKGFIYCCFIDAYGNYEGDFSFYKEHIVFLWILELRREI